MADPYHSNRAQKQRLVASAYQAAMNQPRSRPDTMPFTYPWDSKKVFLHPIHKYQMNEWEYNVYMQEEKDKEAERAAAATETSEKTDPRGGVRENQQYTLALKTAFELGMNAGLMQRPPPPPCAACERRKERNRIAAQTSRIEKRRLELSMAQQNRRVVRSTCGPPPPAPSFTFPTPSASTASNASVSDVKKGDADHEDEEDDEDDENDEERGGDLEIDESQIPPF